MSARKASRKKVHSPVVDEPKFRKCGKAGCPTERPECFANGVERLVAKIDTRTDVDQIFLTLVDNLCNDSKMISLALFRQSSETRVVHQHLPPPCL